MNICFILRGYPTKTEPYQTFSKELIVEFAKKGHKCFVIAPQSITRAITHKVPVRPRHWKESINSCTSIDIYQPYFVSLSKLKTNALKAFYQRTINKTFNHIKDNIDIIYAHFWDMGLYASKIPCNKPLFVGCGESSLDTTLGKISKVDLTFLQKRISGIIYVSKQISLDAIKMGVSKQIPTLIAPNGYNKNTFFKLDRDECRKSLNINNNDFVISFVGFFGDRKGVFRVINAVKDISDTKMILIGKGEKVEANKQIIFCGSLPHDAICKYLCASDVFVLPTKAEGCCNAIIEAMGCGLPIISSNKEFNDDILKDSYSIRVNPENIEEIKNAIISLKRDQTKRTSMGLESLRAANNEFTIESRVDKIIDFVKKTSE